MFTIGCPSWLRRLAGVLCVLNLALCGAWPATVPVRVAETNVSIGEGLRGVVATADTIRMMSWPARGVVRVTEFPPGLIPSLANATAVVSRLVVQTQFVARIARFDGGRDRLYSSFMTVLEMPGGELRPLGTNHFVEEMYGLAKDREAIPNATSKKGMAVGLVESALAFGIRHGALNINLGAMVDPAARPGSLTGQVDGRTLHFDRAFIESLDARVEALTKAGVLVTLVLQNAPTGDATRDRLLLHPGYDTNCPNRLSAFNTVTPEGKLWFRGCLEFLAARYTDFERAHGRVVNFVIGQRVNAHGDWYNLGRAPLEIVVADYERTLRYAWTSVRRHSTVARVFAAVESHWNILPPGRSAEQASPARPFLESLNQLSKRHGDLDWQVAFHAWPESATHVRPWLDLSATTNVNTAVVTFKNLDRLPRFLYQRDQLFRGRPRRVMVCEQGFAAGEGVDAQQVRAAALAYAWVKTGHTVGVESFIFRPSTVIPEAGQGGAGNDRSRNDLFNGVFRAAGTPEWAKVSDFTLPIIGIKSWDDLSAPAK